METDFGRSMTLFFAILPHVFVTGGHRSAIVNRKIGRTERCSTGTCVDTNVGPHVHDPVRRHDAAELRNPSRMVTAIVPGARA